MMWKGLYKRDLYVFLITFHIAESRVSYWPDPK